MKDDSILEIPLIQGPMKKQTDVDLFFNQQEALKRLKQKESEKSRRLKPPRVMNKTFEEIQQLAEQAKQQRMVQRSKHQEERKKAIAIAAQVEADEGKALRGPEERSS